LIPKFWFPKVFSVFIYIGVAINRN